MPGLESSNINTAAEDQMYNKMMLSLLNIVLTPVRSHNTHTCVCTQSSTQARTVTDVIVKTDSNPDPISTGSSGSSGAVSVTVEVDSITVEEKQKQDQVLGLWNQVHGPSDVTYVQKDLWKNLFNWRAFTFKHRSKVLV